MSLLEGITVEFDCKVQKTDRVNLVFDVFGLNVDKYKHVVVDNLIMPSEWDIVYITGVSGSGKTTLLRKIANKYKIDFDNMIFNKFSEKMSKSDTPLIDSIGKDFNESMFLLNTAGLSEAFIYFKRYRELSEGQKYRFYLAKLLESSSDIICVDEFVTALDRVTARIVAFNYQKIVRKLNKRLIVATSHDDLIDTLRPSHVISFDYAGEHHIKKMFFDNKATPPYLNEIEVRRVPPTSKDLQLLKYHYKNTKLPAMVLDIFGFYYKNNIIGLMISSVPIRTYMIDQFYLTEEERKIFSKLNTNERRLVSGNNTANICREVIHPMFRGIGLATHMFEKFIPLTNKRLVLASAAMFNYVKFQEAAGMTYIKPKNASKFEKLTKFFNNNNIDINRIYYDSNYRKSVINELINKKETFKEFLNLIELYTKRYFAGLGGRGIEESNKLRSSDMLEKYLIKLRPTNVKTYYKINENVPIDFSCLNKFRSKLIRKEPKNEQLIKKSIERRALR